MRFATITLTHGPFQDLVERFRWFEALGFDTAWVDDDLIRARVSDFEAWTALGALARETSRIRIGTLVSTIAFRHPTFLAAQAITVDHLSGGRVSVGLGSGACCPEFNKVVGHGEWTPAERADRFEEQVVVLSSLLRGEPIDHPGPYYPTVVPEMHQPVQQPRPPLILAAHGPRALRLRLSTQTAGTASAGSLTTARSGPSGKPSRRPDACWPGSTRHVSSSGAIRRALSARSSRSPSGPTRSRRLTGSTSMSGHTRSSASVR